MVSEDAESTREVAASLGLGPLDQIAFAVDNIDAVLPAYRAMFGAFTVQTATFSNGDDVTYRGAPAHATLKVALGRSGDVEIELIQVVEGEAPTLEHVRRHGDGVHHIRFPVADLIGREADLHAAGFETVFHGCRPSGLKFAYLESPKAFGHTLFELIEFAPGDPRRVVDDVAQPDRTSPDQPHEG
jgi:methylmalonyl-CoA/ethylmalonyl-CoA epimerase